MRLFFTFFFITFITFGQSDTLVLKNIKKQFQEISELQEKEKLIEKEIQYTCEDLSISGDVTFYYKNQHLRFISHSFNQGHHSVSQDYYILDQKLFFYFQTDNYDNDQSIREENTGALLDTKEDWSISEFRVYLDKEKAIKCLVKAYENLDVTDKIKEEYSEFSNYFKNKKVDCDSSKVKEVLLSFNKLIKFQNLNKENTCLLHQ